MISQNVTYNDQNDEKSDDWKTESMKPRLALFELIVGSLISTSDQEGFLNENNNLGNILI